MLRSTVISTVLRSETSTGARSWQRFRNIRVQYGPILPAPTADTFKSEVSMSNLYNMDIFLRIRGLKIPVALETPFPEGGTPTPAYARAHAHTPTRHTRVRACYPLSHGCEKILATFLDNAQSVVYATCGGQNMRNALGLIARIIVWLVTIDAVFYVIELLLRGL